MTRSRSQRRRRSARRLWVLVVAVPVSAGVLVLPACALAAAGTGAHAHSGVGSVLGLGSVFSISDDLATIAKDIFTAFVHALLPSSLTRDGVRLLTWLAALPCDPLGSTYRGVGTLESDMRDVGIAFVPLTLSLSAARYTVSGLTGGTHHPIQSVVRVIGAGFCLIVWPWFFDQVTALINILTSTIFSFSDVHHGLTTLWVAMFGGSAAFGDFAGFAELLIIAAIALVVALIILKVAILVLLAFLFVIGPVAIMLSPVPELSLLTKLFGAIFTAAAIIPVGWALMFALGGAFIGSATRMPVSFSGVANGFLALCAGLLCLFATLKWPTFVIGFARARFGGISHHLAGLHSAGGARAGGVAALPARVAAVRSSIEAGGRTFARSLGAIGGAAGMPDGGPVGAAARLPGRALTARRHAQTAAGIKAGRSASPAAAWEAMYRHTRDNATFTRPRPKAAAARAARVAASTPAAVTASMGSERAQRRVTGPGAPATGGVDAAWGTTHLANARAGAQERSPSVRHEIDADRATRSRPGAPATAAVNVRAGARVSSGSPSPSTGVGGGRGDGSAQRSGARQGLSAPHGQAPIAPARTSHGPSPATPASAASRAAGAPAAPTKPLAAPANPRPTTPAPAPDGAPSTARQRPSGADRSAPPAPPSLPRPDPRPDPRSDQ